MKKKALKYGGLGLLGLIVVVAILQGLGIIKPKEKEVASNMTTEQQTTTQKETIMVQQTTQETMIEETTSIVEKEFNIEECNALQKAYLDINLGISYDDVITIINKYDLFYDKSDDNKVIKIADNKETAKLRYAESGDFIEISLEEEEDKTNNKVKIIEYYANVVLINIKSGTALRLEEGLYVDNGENLFKGNDERYIKFETKEEQIKYDINYKR